MTAALRSIPRDAFADHRARELAELNNMLSAQQRGDTKAAREHMERMYALVRGRPVAMVEAMERSLTQRIGAR